MGAPWRRALSRAAGLFISGVTEIAHKLGGASV
jgi:hypothetical protein